MGKFLHLFLIFFVNELIAQIGIGTSTVNADAQLELFSTNQGLLVPRLDLIDVNDPTPLTAHVQGMIVFNQSANGTGLNRVVTGLYYNDGTKWILFVPNTIKIGDVKHSFATADHDGWYLLNGRAISTLSVSVQANANSIGLTTNLIDATDRFLKAKKSAEVIGSTNGTNTFTISQANLPNVDFIGTTSNDGAHSHLLDSYLGFQSIGLLSTSALTLFSIEQVAKDDTQTSTRTTEASGDHSHTVTVASGGTNTPVVRTPSFITTNVFIYLGK